MLHVIYYSATLYILFLSTVMHYFSFIAAQCWVQMTCQFYEDTGGPSNVSEKLIPYTCRQTT